MHLESRYKEANDIDFSTKSCQTQTQIGKTNAYSTDRHQCQSTISNANSDLLSESIPETSASRATNNGNRRIPQHRQRRSSSRSSQDYFDIGYPEFQCEYCGAFFWYHERCARTSVRGHMRYNLCCRGGRVDLPRMRPPPPYLDSLMCSRDHPLSHHFRQNIKKYNNVFAFTSMGARIDEQINDGRGPYLFRVSGQVCHMMGSILPPEGRAPAFAQLYMHDTENEIENRMSSFHGDGNGDPPRQEIIQQLSLMLDEHNAIVRGYRSVNERLAGLNLPEYRLCIRNNPIPNSSQYSMPQASEVVGLVVGDLSAEQRERDLIVEHRSNGLQRVSSTHPLHMAMQYPLLFPYGEPGYDILIWDELLQ